MLKLMDLLTEGVHDKGIFKAVFLAGGPGSGKSYVAKQLFGIPDRFNISSTGMKMINQDKELKFLLKKYGFDPAHLASMPDELFQNLTGKGDDASGLRDFSKHLNTARMKGYMRGKLGMIIDGTGHNYGKIAKKKQILEDEGYDCYMVFVNTSLDVAQKRNTERDRVLPANIVQKSWQDVQNNLGQFQSLFNNKFVIVDNSKFLSAKDAANKFGALTKKHINKWSSEPIKNPKGKQWVRDQLRLKKAGIKK
jgi:predicted kinase